MKKMKLVKQSGASLIELILAVVVIALLSLLISRLQPTLSSINKSRNQSLARDIATKEIDYLRKQPYNSLLPGESSFSDAKLSSLPTAAASYIIEDCPEQFCTPPEAIKKIKVKVSYSEAGTLENVELTTLITSGGLGQ